MIGADVPSLNLIVCIHSSQEETHFSFKDSSVLFNNECEVTSLPLPQLHIERDECGYKRETIDNLL